MKRSSAYKWTVLAILMLGTAILYYSNMIFAVRALDTLSKFNIDEGELAAISTIGCLPGAFLSIIVGRVLDKKGVKLFTALTPGADRGLHGLAHLCPHLYRAPARDGAHRHLPAADNHSRAQDGRHSVPA